MREDTGQCQNNVRRYFLIDFTIHPGLTTFVFPFSADADKLTPPTQAIFAFSILAGLDMYSFNEQETKTLILQV